MPPPDTRAERSRAVVTNALTKPLNIAIPAVLIVAGLLLHLAIILVPLAIVVYGLLAGFTLFDEGEAKRVLSGERKRGLPAAPEVDLTGLPPRIAESLTDAREEERKIGEAIAQAKLPYGEVPTEIGVLLREMERVARKAAVIDTYLADEAVQEAPEKLQRLRRESTAGGDATDARQAAVTALEEQVKIKGELQKQLERSYDELDHLVASLGVIRGQIVRMSVAEDATMDADLGAELRDLRERVSTLADGMTAPVAPAGPVAPA